MVTVIAPSRTDNNGDLSALFDRVANIVESARKRALYAVNHETVTTYWMIGRKIVQMLQGGEIRAQYGNAAIVDLATRLTEHYGSGYAVINLEKFRQFYLAYVEKSQ